MYSDILMLAWHEKIWLSEAQNRNTNPAWIKEGKNYVFQTFPSIFFYYYSLLWFQVSKVVLVPQFEPRVVEDVKNNAYKPRYHPGRRSTEVLKAPDKVHDAAKIIISKIQEPNLQTDGEMMRRYMKARQAPAEKREMVKNMHQLKEDFLTKSK